MGYSPYTKLNIDFSKTRYAGAKVKCRLDLSITEIDAYDAEIEGKEMAERYEIWAERFLIEWNLEDDDGKSLPIGKEGARLAPAPLMGWAMSTWRSAMWDVAAPLDE